MEINSRWDTDGDTSHLALQPGENSSDGLGCTGCCGDNVVEDTATWYMILA